MKNENILALGSFIIIILAILSLAVFVIISAQGSSEINLNSFWNKGVYIIGGLVLIISLIAVLMNYAKYTKDFVISVGRKILDVCTILDIFLCAIIFVIGCFQYFSENGGSSNILWYMIGSIVVFFITVLANFTLYLLIDMRDSLRKIADYIDQKEE